MSLSVLMAVHASELKAQEWTGSINGEWNVGGNWSTGTAPSASQIAIFSQSHPSTGVTTLGSNQIIDGLRFESTATSDLSLGSFNDYLLTLDGGANPDVLIDVGSGAHTLWSALALTGSTQEWLNHSDYAFTAAGNLTLSQSVNFGGTGIGGWVIGSADSTTLISGADRNFVVANTGAEVDLTLHGLFKLTDTSNQRILRVAPAAGTVVDIFAVLANGDAGNGAVTIGYTAGNTGTVNLNATKTYSGTTTINHGATLNVNAAITNSGAWDIDGAILNWNMTNTEMGSLYLGGGGLNTESHLNIAEGVTMNLGANIITENSNSQSGRAYIRGGSLALNANRTIEVKPSSSTDAELTIESIITDGSKLGSSITKTRNGTLILTADNTFTGNTTLNDGELILDHRTNNGDKLSATGNLILGGGTLTFLANSQQTSQQVVSSTTLTSIGANTISVVASPGQRAEISLGNITRANSIGATLHVELHGDQAAVLTSNANVNGILGGYAVVTDATGQYFATVRDQKIVTLNQGHYTETQSQFQNDVSTWQIGANASAEDDITGTSNQLDLNSLRFSGSTDLHLVDQLNLRSGGLLISEGTTASGIYGGSLTVPIGAFNGELIVHQDSASEFTIASSIVRHHNSSTTHADITKSGAGTLILAGRNFTGARNSSTGSGSIRIAEGVLALAGGNAISDVSTISIEARAGAALRLLHDEAVGNVTGGGFDGGEIQLGAHTLTINTSANQTFQGAWTGSGTIIKQNMGAGALSSNLVITSVSSTAFTGKVQVNGGTFLLGGNNLNTFINASEFTVNRNGALYIDNNGTTSGGGNKIGNTATITLNGANGNFASQPSFRGFGMRNDQNGTREETVGVISANRGANYMTLEASNTGTSALTRLIASNLTRNQHSTLSLRGTNLGPSSGRRTNFRLQSANESAFRNAHLTGGNGAISSSTMSIVAWAIGQNLGANTLSTTENHQLGNSLLTYVNTHGFRALDFATEYTTYANASETGTSNVRDTLNTADLTGLGSKDLNAWVINNANTTAARRVEGEAGASLNLRSGTLLFTALDNNHLALSQSSAKGVALAGFDAGLTTSSGEYIVFQNNLAGVTLESNLTSTAKLTKSGIGTLILTGNNSALTDVTLNEGTVQISSLQNLGGDDGTLYFSGGTLKLDSTFIDDLSSKQIIVLGEANLQGNNGGRMGVLDTNGINTTFYQPISGDGEFVKTGLGTLTLGGTTATTHTGTFVLEQTMAGSLNSSLVQLILDNAGGNAIGGNLQMGAYALPSAKGGAVARLARDEQIADHGVISFTGGADKHVYFNMMGFNETIAGLRDTSGGGVMQVNQAGTTSTASTLTLAGDDDYYHNGYLRNSASGGGGKLNVIHTGTGRQTLAGGNIAYSGQTTNTAGVLQYRDALNFDGAIYNDAEVEFEQTTATAWNYSGGLSGSGVFTKTGIGTGSFTLDAINTTTGSLIVKAGELGLGTNGSITEAQLVEVYANATFASADSVASTHHGAVTGNGTLKGNFILTKGMTSAGHLRPGASTHRASSTHAGNLLGHLDVTGNLTLTGGSAVGDGSGAQATFQIARATLNDASGLGAALHSNNLAAYLNTMAESLWNDTSTVDGVSGLRAHDSLSLTGGLTWDNGSTISLEAMSGYTASYGDVIDLFDWSAALSGSAVFADGSNRHSGGLVGDLWLPTLQGDLFYDLSAFRTHGLIAVVPEPSRVLSLSAALLALGLRRKRRR